MTLNLAHWHLLLNHFPIIGMIFGLGLLLVSFFGKNEDLRRASYIVFATVGLLTVATFLTGFGAQEMLMGKPGVSGALIQRHEGSAMLSVWFVELTGILAVIGLWQYHSISRPAHWNVVAVLFVSLLSMGLIARTGNTGGEITHSEVRADLPAGQNTPAEGTIGSIIHHFEPVPEKFSSAILDSKPTWAFLMASHFIGLALIIGTVGILDLRIMGFLKQLPAAPFHRFMPYALAGLGINIVTGLLAFAGQPENYVFSAALWLKILALMLLGLNGALFYLTGVFGRVNSLQAGEDAPISAKLLAFSSLFLCFALILFGRYIQPLGNTLRIGSN